MKVYNNLDMLRNQLVNVVLQAQSAAPSSPVVGQGYYSTSALRPLFWNGSAWNLSATDSALLNGQAAAFYLARANHTGTQLANTISDLATTVQAYRLDQFAAPNVAVSFNSQKITNLADPTNPQDAATKAYVDLGISNAAAGIDCKPSVRVVANANITLSGTQTIDGVAVIAGDRVLARGQSAGAANGVYVVAAGAWARAVDGDTSAEMTPGAFWYVEEGTTYGKTQWRLENTGTIILGTTALTINQWGSTVNYTAGNGLLLTGTVFSAVVVASGGVLVGGSGLQVDTAIVVRKYSVSIGDGTNTVYTVTHNLGTKDIILQARLNSNDEAVIIDWVATSTNTVTVTAATVVASNAIRIVIHA